MTPADPAERHELFAAAFTELARGTRDWDAPAPVAGWTARDVVAHLVEWFAAFLATGGVSLPEGPPVADEPVAAWMHHADAVQALLDDPSTADSEFSHPMAGTHRLADAIDQFYTADVFMHGWDLARASGQRYEMDAGFASQLLAGMRAMEDVIRASGQYGEAVPVPVDATVADQLIGLIGRDPAWRPG